MPRKKGAKSRFKKGEVTPAITSFLSMYFKRHKVLHWGRAHTPKDLHRATIGVVCSKLASHGYLKYVGRKSYAATPSFARTSQGTLVRASLRYKNGSRRIKNADEITRAIVRLVRKHGAQKTLAALVEAVTFTATDNTDTAKLAQLERDNATLKRRLARIKAI